MNRTNTQNLPIRVGYKERNWFSRLWDNMKGHPWLYIMFLPVLAYYVIFHYWPMYGVIIAFKDFKPMLGIFGSKWVGLAQFREFIESPYLWRVLRNTLGINLGMLVFASPLPIIFALLLNECKSVAFRKVVQTVTYMPHFVSTVIVCYLMITFCRGNGLITRMLGVFGVPQKNLFSVARYFKPLYIGMNIWQELGWESIIYFAALTAIDASLYEAATVDGAGRWQQMWNVTLPGILPTVVILLIMRIGSLMSLGWDKIYLLYNEMIYETADVISTYVYRMGMTRMQYSYSTAVGLMNSAVNIVLLVSANIISARVTENSLW
ncbi:MAG: ABC transporter permease [Christensenellales bacterium]|jgi:putative aldouronate transport system permease protein